MQLIYDEKDFCIVIKPPALLSEPDESGHDIVTVLKKHFEDINKPTDIFTVHRLDFGVGGMMIFAKNSKTAGRLAEQMSSRTFGKEYLAVIRGKPEGECGIYKDLLFKDSSKNKSFVVKRKRAGVREASLEYRLIKSIEYEGETLSLVLIKLHTGRTHQIRVQFSSRQTPLFGDRKYGGRGGDIALFSHKLCFEHPKTGENMCFFAFPEGEIWKLFGDLESEISKALQV